MGQGLSRLSAGRRRRWGWLLLGAAVTTGCGGPASAPGVIVLCLDTLRADHLGPQADGTSLTPNLDRLATQAVVFDHAQAQSNETLYSHASLFTSRYPSELDVLDTAFRLPGTAPTLASVFQDAGWATAAVVAGGHLSAAFGLGGGFASYDDAESWGSLRDTGARALRWLDERPDAPFFLFVHGYDTHDRYLKPPPFGYGHADPAAGGVAGALVRAPGGTSDVVERRVLPSDDALFAYAEVVPRLGAVTAAAIAPDGPVLDDADVDHVRGVYAGSVAWADAALGLFMAGLDDRGLLDTTTIVVLSDHGEDLGEGGSFNHRFALSDDTLHVPLMVRRPGGAGGGVRVDDPVALLDVAPTVWALAGLHPPAGVRGESLVPSLSGGATPERPGVFSQGALRLLSVRTPTSRLTAVGLSVHNPWTPALVAATPVGGPGLVHAGDPDAALQDTLVAWLSGLDTPPRAQR